jgi:glucan phosphoethanolaminetransferase (alkaline phosphatase superfamily)
MNKLIRLIITGAVILGVGGVLLPVGDVYAVNVFEPCTSNSDSSVCAAQGDDAASMVQIVINILLYILGVIAVLMIIIGGIRYTTSNGEASGIKSAKDTILYAVIGLIVAILAYAIVNFVVEKFLF